MAHSDEGVWCLTLSQALQAGIPGAQQVAIDKGCFYDSDERAKLKRQAAWAWCFGCGGAISRTKVKAHKEKHEEALASGQPVGSKYLPQGAYTRHISLLQSFDKGDSPVLVTKPNQTAAAVLHCVVTGSHVIAMLPTRSSPACSHCVLCHHPFAMQL